MSRLEQPLVFACGTDRLVGILNQPENPLSQAVLIVVGGPQYRSGSHRQFTLLARQLAQHGIASLRFDYRGMGDSEGAMRSFEDVDDDLRSATDLLFAKVPGIQSVALWGLCDAASASMMYASTDPRISSLIMLNPWVHSEQGAARARLKHYYLKRLAQPSFWSKLLTGHFRWGSSLADLANSARQVSARHPTQDIKGEARKQSGHFILRMLNGFRRFKGNTLFILSGNDLTAQEFTDLTTRDRHWERVCTRPHVSHVKLHEANHTFSTREWRDRVADATRNWLLNQQP